MALSTLPAVFFSAFLDSCALKPMETKVATPSMSLCVMLAFAVSSSLSQQSMTTVLELSRMSPDLPPFTPLDFDPGSNNPVLSIARFFSEGIFMELKNILLARFESIRSLNLRSMER